MKTKSGLCLLGVFLLLPLVNMNSYPAFAGGGTEERLIIGGENGKKIDLNGKTGTIRVGATVDESTEDKTSSGGIVIDGVNGNIFNKGGRCTVADTVKCATALGKGTHASEDYSTAWGKGSYASGWAGTAWGYYTTASSDQATAWGEETEATGYNSTAWGRETEADGRNSTAWGRETSASGYAATAWGKNSRASADYSTAFGHKSRAEGKYSTVFGRGLSSRRYCTETGDEIFYDYDSDEWKNAGEGMSYTGKRHYPRVGDIMQVKKDGGDEVIAQYKVTQASRDAGYTLKRISGEGEDIIKWRAGLRLHSGSNELYRGNVAWGKASTAFGFLSRAEGDFSTAFGVATHAVGYLSTAFGKATHAGGKYSTAWGVETKADGKRATAWGYGTEALGKNSTSWGYNTAAHDGRESTAFGYQSEASGDTSTAWGHTTKATGERATSWGFLSEASGMNSTAWGNRTVAGDERATAWGYKSLALGHDATAFGHGARAEGKHSTAWGYKSLASGWMGTAFGEFVNAGGKGAVAFGLGHPVPVGTDPEEFDDPREADPAYGALGDYSLAFGIESTAGARNSFAALGGRTDTAAVNSAALGVGAVAHLSDSIALGSGSAASRAAGMTGYGIHGNPGSSAVWTATMNAVSVGDVHYDNKGVMTNADSAITRQITGVAAGTLDTDAVNVAQLKALWEKVEKTHTAVTVEGGETAVAEVPEDPEVSGPDIGLNSKSVFQHSASSGSPEMLMKSGKGNLSVKKKFVVAENGDSTYKRPVYDISLNKDIDLGKNGSLKIGDTLMTPQNITLGADNAVNISSSGSAHFGGIHVDGANGRNEISGLANTEYIDGVTGSGSRENIAATEGQLRGAMNRVDGDINKINNRLGDLEDDIKGTTALGTAMASLKPIQYDPMEPTQIMAGVGYYRDKWALALGMAHYVREDYMIHAGVSCGGSHRIAVGAGLTIKLGRREDRDRLPGRYRKGPISSAYVMQRENTKLRKNVHDLERELNDVKASQLAEKRRNDALQKRLEHLEKLLAR